MAEITFKGTKFRTSGDLPAVGAKAPDFKLTKGDLSDVTLKDFAGKRFILNIFPSVDTGVCAASVRRFNEAAAKLPDTAILGVSRDLPFAFKRFCGAEGIDKVAGASEMRDASFGDAYGLRIMDGPLAGLLARAVVVVGSDGKVEHSQLVTEITNEPDYDAALAVLK